MKIPYEVTIFLSDGQVCEETFVLDDRKDDCLTEMVIRWASDNGLCYDDFLSWQSREIDDIPASYF